MSKYGYDSCSEVLKEQKLTKEAAWDLWSDPASKGIKGNSPKDYLDGENRSAHLVELTKEYLGSDSSILEIGCNVGRNLNCFLKNGYSSLLGIEINKNAILLMKEFYRDLYNTAHIFNEPVENCIQKIPNKSCDLVYTMAVLEHIHYNSEFIFEEIKRIAAKYIITVEDETTSWSNRHFPRNYQKIFEDKNWKQVYNINGKKTGVWDDRFVVRVFESRK